MKQMFVRAAEFQLRSDGDGRTLEGRIVPYGEVADIVELDESTSELVRYREQFLPHSLAAVAQGFQARGGRFIPLLIDHTDNFDNMVGHCIDLRSEDDGAYGSFRLYEDERLMKVRSVLSESHKGLSIMFKDIREPKLIDGVVSRVQVHVAHVAATPTPAYVGAGIASIRSNGSDDLVEDRPKLNDIRAWLEQERNTR